MARRVSFEVDCDLCLNDSEDTSPAEAVYTMPMSINGARPRTLDLCHHHYEYLVAPLIAALEKYGLDEVAEREEYLEKKRGPTTAERYRWGWKRKVGPLRCLVPGCAATPLKTASTLEQHLLRLHDQMTLEDYIATYGELVPLTPEQQAEVVVEVRCEVPGCDRVYSTALGNRKPQQAMISHMWGHHAIKWRPGTGDLV